MHAQISADQYGQNTPTKRASHSGIWVDIKRLRGSLNNAEGDGTHICLVALKSKAAPGAPHGFCNTILKLHKSKATLQTGSQSWLTTRGAEHLAKEHPIDSVMGAKFARDARQRQEDLTEKQMSFGMPNGEGGVVETDNNKFMLTRKEKALSSQAQWYVYSTMHISKSEFESAYFRRMLAAGEEPDNAHVITERNLKQYVQAEFGMFKHFLKFMLWKKHDDAMGNRFAQGLHDGGTLVSKKKYQALALQFVAPEWKKNLVVTIGLKKSSQNADADIAHLWKETMDERCGGLKFDDIMGRMRSDRAAKGVAGVLEFEEEEVCEMYDTEKLGRSATGGSCAPGTKSPLTLSAPASISCSVRTSSARTSGTRPGLRIWPLWGRLWGMCQTFEFRRTTTRPESQRCTACCTPSSASTAACAHTS